MATQITRRVAVVGACGAACVGALAACSADGSGTTGPADSGGGTAGGPLGSAADIPVGGGRIFGAQGVVVTQPTAGQFKAFTTTCTHTGCKVNEVTGGTINCPCHGSRYAIADGSVVGGPAPRPLPEKRITVSGGSVTLA